MRAWLAIAVVLAASSARADPERSGFLLGAVVGANTLLATEDTPASAGPLLGLRLGSQFGNGLSTSVRFEYLGTAPFAGGTPVKLLTMDARYTFDRVIAPFAEAAFGLGFLDANAPLAPGGGPLEIDLAAGLAAGAEYDLTPNLTLELALRARAIRGLDTTLPFLGATLGLTYEIDRP